MYRLIQNVHYSQQHNVFEQRYAPRRVPCEAGDFETNGVCIFISHEFNDFFCRSHRRKTANDRNTTFKLKTYL